MVLSKVGLRRLVVLLAGHDQQGHFRFIPTGEGEHLLGVDLKQAPTGNGANRIGAFGGVVAQPGALPACDHDDGDAAYSQRLLPPSCGRLNHFRYQTGE